jgi:uncharacterized lipoprotein YddW (UPF0748 family)
MIKKITLLTAFMLLLFTAIDSFASQWPKREFRATWLTTAWGLDWPATRIPSGGGPVHANLQKQQLILILDSLQIAGMNAVFFQVRGEGDALYPSSFEPWSACLTTRRGIDPGYDPLEFAIAECHKRGMELHAWINPYRFESIAGKYAGHAGDYRKSNPEWVLTYNGGGSILDPGNPHVQKRIADIVGEIVSCYDIDGIVFDDYFYGYEGTPATLDLYSQKHWKPADMSLADWRRRNINHMIAAVYKTIKSEKPWVSFGVSPFGIWTIDPKVAASYGLTLPQGITGLDAYKTIYCDPVAWLQEGIVDYISPQLYWPTTSRGQDYKKLAPWWSEIASRYGRHIYISHSLNNLSESAYRPPVAGKAHHEDFGKKNMQGLSMVEYYSHVNMPVNPGRIDPVEYGRQIQWNRNSDLNQAPGSVFFRATMFLRKGFMNYLRTHEFAALSLPPVKFWNKVEPRMLPSNLRIENNHLVWDSKEENVRFSIYSIPKSISVLSEAFQDSRFLVGLTYETSFNLGKEEYDTEHHKLAIAIIDRFGNEFPPVFLGDPAPRNEMAYYPVSYNNNASELQTNSAHTSMQFINPIQASGDITSFRYLISENSDHKNILAEKYTENFLTESSLLSQNSAETRIVTDAVKNREYQLLSLQAVLRRKTNRQAR